ncbi:hypothetical protein CALCODRAFT_546577 [Calocera cornea HHB12733]|uniref:DUF6532 domain-containing protein n=1 Tax=Calocera cornea HHB12733 TaxID=1353952 RepID=A0A165EMA6_9BASI|nr:hypothetical protein CALCODRAFT_546577 [Calocera cornea HHB12733]
MVGQAPFSSHRSWIINPPPKDDHKGENLSSYHPAMQKVLRLAKRYNPFAEAARDAANKEARSMDPDAPQIDFDTYPGQKTLIKRVGIATRNMLKTKALQVIESEYPEAVQLAKTTAALQAAWAAETRKKKKKELELQLIASTQASQQAFSNLRKDAHFIYRHFDCLQRFTSPPKIDSDFSSPFCHSGISELSAKLAAYILAGEDNDTSQCPELFTSIPPRLIAAAVTGVRIFVAPLNHGFSCYESGLLAVKRFKGLDPENQGTYEDICKWLNRYRTETPKQYNLMIAAVTHDYVYVCPRKSWLF